MEKHYITPDEVNEDNWFGASPRHPGNRNVEQYYYEEDQELPPFHVFMQTYADESPKTFKWMNRDYRREICFDDKEWWSALFFENRFYDYRNLYNPFCQTAVYYFLEDIILDFDDMEDDDEYYPFGWFDFFTYCASIGVKLPTYGDDGGKYGKSIMWE